MFGTRTAGSGRENAARAGRARCRLAVAVVALVVASAGAGCGGGDAADGVDAGEVAPDDRCEVAPGEAVSFDPAAPSCGKLSSYRFFVGDQAALAPNEGVVPYDVNTPLFSDYTRKQRFVWLPEGAAMTYHPDESFDAPVGAVFLKTFAYPDDLRDPDGARRLLETRLLYHAADGWRGVTYVWNDDQTDAELEIAGATIAASWIHTDGQRRELDYSVPNQNKCKNCHEERDDVVLPIGPKARHLNRDFDYADGTANQIVRLADIGYLTNIPADPGEIPRGAVWDDPATGTVDDRARMWLDINCAHCHNPRGAARTSGLDLSIAQDNPFEYGVCKSPIAAGAGSGGHQYNIVPGSPDESIFMFRLLSTEPDVQMPEVGRKLIDDEGVALIREWITQLPGDCESPTAAP